MPRELFAISLYILASVCFGFWQSSLSGGLFCFFMIATCDEMFH